MWIQCSASYQFDVLNIFGRQVNSVGRTGTRLRLIALGHLAPRQARPHLWCLPSSLRCSDCAVEHLREGLDRLLQAAPNADAVRERLDNLVSVYPFNEFEYLISHLLAADVLTLDDYQLLRDEYISRNLYLYIFEISSPRGFGEAWAQGHLKELVPELTKPTKKTDKEYQGQYDFLLDGQIRIEVKVSRAVDAHADAPLYVKALASDSDKPFRMNFQQIKPGCCDVFVWVAVWRDVIRYW